MNPERYKQVDQILQQALSQPPESLKSFLDQACVGDEALRRDVESLIEHERRAGSSIGSAVSVAIPTHHADEKQRDLAGCNLSHYQVIEKIGEGGMGVVYRAQDTHLKRSVALKLLPADRVSDSERKRRFVKEARAASALNHPNIVTIYDIDQADGVDFIAMEYVPGTTLDRQIPRKGMPIGTVLDLGIQMASGLAAAHSAGIVHRDLKPANAMVSDTGQVKILDFGLAKLGERESADGASSLLGTDEGVILGTVAYMSPEQAQGKKVDARSDVFSFGAVLYEMVTGQMAFDRDSPACTLAAIIRDEPKALGETAPGVPAELEHIIQRCLRKEPERRFQAMADVGVELQELKEGLDSRRQADQQQRRVRSFRWLVPAALFAVLLAWAGWSLLRPKGESKPVLIAAPFTTYPGVEYWPAFSPDGNQVAFSWTGEEGDNLDVYVKSVGSEKPLRLTSDPGLDAHVSWSRDGSHIVFTRWKNSRFAVYTIPPVGGGERKVYESTYVWKPWLNGRYLTSTPDSQGFVISKREAPDDPNSLVLVRLDTGKELKLTSPPTGVVGDVDPAFSPDGRILTFTRVRAIASFNDLYRLDLSGDLRPVGQPQPLTDGVPVKYRNFFGHAWTGNGREIIASLQRGPAVYDFWRIPVEDPRRSTRLEFAGEGGLFPAISGPARRMIYTREQPRATSTWSLEDSTESTKKPGPKRLFGSSQSDTHSRVSPDGAKIAFQSTRSGFAEICVCNSDGSGFVRLTDYHGPLCGSPAWSPDSRWIAYDARPEGQSEIYVISSEGGQPRRITNHPGDDVMPSWSRNGRSIYLTSNRTGSWQVWKMPSGGGEPVQVTKEGGWYAQESLDGKILFLGKALAELGVYRTPVEGGAVTMFLSDANIELFAPATKGYYYWKPDRVLAFLDSVTGAGRIVTAIDQLPAQYLSVFPDGKHILYSQVEQASADLYLVENFR